jgi:photosystem II stability/assembly factor-like uncharacterized protein
MKKYLFRLTLLTLMVMSPSLFAQSWVEMMNNPEVNFYEVQKAFNKYYVKKERQVERMKKRMSKQANEGVHHEEIEVPGFAQYKRWENFMKPRVGAKGERFDPSMAFRENQKYRAMMGTANAGNWTLIGPSTSIPIGGGAGRLNFVRIHPTDPNTIFVGAPAGGLWKSTDGGATWSTNTDHLSQVIGCTDLAIDPNNPDIMYLATGDGDGGDTYTIGILKSIDGGTTWNTTGLSYFMANTRQISKILLDPNNTSTLLVASSAGVFRSTDAAATFTNVQTGSFKDMEFKPGDPNTVYVSGTEVYRSNNNGQNWTKVTLGLPASALVSRLALAVTANDNNYVYVLAAKAAPDFGFEGIYRSTNGGSTFTKITTSTPVNVLGWNSNGGDTGGQGWYDLTIAASPTNKDEIITGGVNLWRSTNGGSSFTLNGHWTGSGAPYTHADNHDIIFVNGTTAYVANDGGLYKTTDNGASWTDLSNGLQIAQMYGFGQSTTNPSLIIQGWQDNGTNRFLNGTWQEVLGGDGMLGFIDWNNDQNMWGSQPDGSLFRSTNGGNSWNGATGGINETGGWVTPWSQDPLNAGTLYSGFLNMWKSTNGGISWTKISNFTSTSTMTTFAVSPANTQVIWAAKPSYLYLTTNGGTNWTTISNVPSGTITGIACSNTDPNKVWITYSGFNNSNKVFQSNDQGASWINLSGSIPNIPINCIVYENNSPTDAIYIGTDVGAFYKNSSLSVWQPFSNGLPNVIVTELHIQYATGKVRASTYGRGMWESNLYVPGSYPPISAFGASSNIACPGSAVQYTDYSSGQPTSWDWSFPGGNPSTSTQQNPLVNYNVAGNYPVTLITTNANGIDTTVINNYINIASSTVPDPTTIGAVRCGPGPVSLSASGSGTGTLRWWDAPGGGNVVNTGSTYNPTITGTTTYYVDEDLPPGVVDYTGESVTNIGAGAFFTANDIRGLYFDVLSPVILQSVEVYSNSAGNRTIEIIDAQGNTYADTTIFIPFSGTSPTTVNVNFTLYPGTNYFIKCRGLVDLYRNSSGAVYPYLSTAVNITGSNAGSPGYYYFFYFWTFQEITCNTGRTAVVALDTCAVIGIEDIFSTNTLELFPNPSDGKFNLTFDAKVQADYLITITNTLGKKVFEYPLLNFAGEHKRDIDLSNLSKGLYLVNISSGDKKITRKMNLR